MPNKTNVNINGKDYARVKATVGKDSDGKSICKQFYGKSLKEARQKRDEYLHNIQGGLSLGFDKLTFGEAYRQWFETVHKPN